LAGNPNSFAAQKLKQMGAEMVQVGLEDMDPRRSAMQGVPEQSRGLVIPCIAYRSVDAQGAPPICLFGNVMKQLNRVGPDSTWDGTSWMVTEENRKWNNM
jgi:hypothetical protein